MSAATAVLSFAGIAEISGRVEGEDRGDGGIDAGVAAVAFELGDVWRAAHHENEVAAGGVARDGDALGIDSEALVVGAHPA